MADPVVAEPVVEPAAAPDYSDKTLEQVIAERNAAGDTFGGVIDTPDEPVAQEAGEVESAGAAVPGAPAATEPPVAPIEDPYAEWGGREVVEDAVNVANALRTETGVRTVIAQGLQALGYSPAQIQAALAGGPAAVEAAVEAAAPTGPADPLEGYADDDVVNVSDVRKLVEAQVAAATAAVTAQVEQQLTPLQQQVIEQQTTRAQNAVDSTIFELLQVDGQVDPALATEVLRYANQHITDATRYDPEAIRNAIISGKAEAEAAIEAAHAAYLRGKAAVKATLPTPVVAASPGAEAPAEPQSIEEASAEMRKRGWFKNSK
jgi:hypothetical protein